MSDKNDSIFNKSSALKMENFNVFNEETRKRFSNKGRTLSKFDFLSDPEFLNREALLRKSVYYEFPHTFVSGFQNPFTIHTLFKHIIQDRGYNIDEEGQKFYETPLPWEYNIIGGISAHRNFTKDLKGSGTSTSKSLTQLEFKLELYISYTGIYQISEKGGGLGLKTMLAGHLDDAEVEDRLRNDFETIKGLIPGILQISIQDPNWDKEGIKPLTTFVEGYMPYIPPPTSKLSLPGDSERKFKKQIENRFPIRYKYE